jgi:hypothetical protein
MEKFFLLLLFILICISCSSKKNTLSDLNDLKKDNQELAEKYDNVIKEAENIARELRVKNIRIAELQYEMLRNGEIGEAIAAGNSAGQENLMKIESQLNKAKSQIEALEKQKKGLQTKMATIQPKVVTKQQLVLPENLIGNVAFTCPTEMREQQTYKVNAMLGTLFSKEEVQESLLASINESRRENKKDLLTKEDILTRQVNLGYYVKIELKDSANKFDIKSIDDVNVPIQQVLDFNSSAFLKKTFEWKWDVTPKEGSNCDVAVLNLVITPLNKDKVAIESKIKDYEIEIHFKQSFLASVWEEMNSNIPWAISTIIAPIITFLVGRYLKSKETKVT